jgi:hypothetical protein
LKIIAATYHQVFSFTRRHPVFAGETNCIMRAGQGAFSAKYTPSEIDAKINMIDP